MAGLYLRADHFLKWLAVLPIHFYQSFLRQLHNRECIYTPSCSNYTIAAIWKYGAWRGWIYGLRRIKRCDGAISTGGEDPP